jgi:serine/threonine protein kinase
MGAVYAALDTRLDRKLALKVMLPQFAANHAARERFLREARAAAKISHDNVVTIYEADERDGVPYIAMQFLQGYPLDEYLKKGQPELRTSSPDRPRDGGRGVRSPQARPRSPRHQAANLWLEAPNGRVKVLDFGLAKPVDAEVALMKSGAIVGTPAVSDKGLSTLKECRGLTSLSVTNTKVTPQGLADFNAALPACRVDYTGGVIETVDVNRKASEWCSPWAGLSR